MGMTFDSFLVEPVQRVPRYRLLLTELLKYTADGDADFVNLNTALSIVRLFIFLKVNIGFIY